MTAGLHNLSLGDKCHLPPDLHRDRHAVNTAVEAGVDMSYVQVAGAVGPVFKAILLACRRCIERLNQAFLAEGLAYQAGRRLDLLGFSGTVIITGGEE
jgi:hypothetical protein